jgi:hypothetical protein
MPRLRWPRHPHRQHIGVPRPRLHLHTMRRHGPYRSFVRAVSQRRRASNPHPCQPSAMLGECLGGRAMNHVWLIIDDTGLAVSFHTGPWWIDSDFPLGWSAKKVTHDDGMAALKESAARCANGEESR